MRSTTDVLPTIRCELSQRGRCLRSPQIAWNAFRAPLGKFDPLDYSLRVSLSVPLNIPLIIRIRFVSPLALWIS